MNYFSFGTKVEYCMNIFCWDLHFFGGGESSINMTLACGSVLLR